jgi:hypothetical protein
MCFKILIAVNVKEFFTFSSALASSGRVLAGFMRTVVLIRGVNSTLDYLVVGLRIELRTCTLWGYRSKPTELSYEIHFIVSFGQTIFVVFLIGRRPKGLILLTKILSLQILAHKMSSGLRSFRSLNFPCLKESSSQALLIFLPFFGELPTTKKPLGLLSPEALVFSSFLTFYTVTSGVLVFTALS